MSYTYRQPILYLHGRQCQQDKSSAVWSSLPGGRIEDWRTGRLKDWRTGGKENN